MSTATLIVVVINLAYIGLLPRLFFRKDGRFNVRWWLTAAPFFLSTALVVAQFSGIVRPLYPTAFADVAEVIAVTLCLGSIGLISLTLGTHRRKLALWHQHNDAPEEIVTYGAYRYVRHPFYAAFIMTLFASFVLCLSVWSALLLVYGVFGLNMTAAREEARLRESAFGELYRAYIQRTGRFFPKFGADAGTDLQQLAR